MGLHRTTCQWWLVANRTSCFGADTPTLKTTNSTTISKLSRFVQYYEDEDPRSNMLRKVSIYSLRTNLWKTIEHEVTRGRLCIDYPVLVQNHLIVMIFYDNHYLVTGIGCFDIKAERWSNDVLLSDILLSEIDSKPTQDGHYCLGVLDGGLRFSFYGENKSTYNVWVMKDFGVKASWVKLMSFIVQGPEAIFNPISYRKGSSHEVLCISKFTGKCFWYNLRDKQLTETGFDTGGFDTNHFSYACICKGSLLNFPGCQPIHSASNE
ncbi:F-box protein CPR1-like [Silene latifolia]|uniref:F-box protein CPR1-like n=1 Tax=Silene latifolia TaxID=37657 RepID=UPI003D776A57